jgi:hypothetical protein
MANAAAWQSGFQLAEDAMARRRERKQQLSDEERQLRVSDLYDKGHRLAATIPQLSGDERQKAMGQLTDIEASIHSIYHPDNAAPGALQRDWDFLKGLITRKPRPQPGSMIGRTTTTPEPGLPAADVRVPVEAVTAPGLTLPASTVAMTQPAAPEYQRTTYTPPSPAQMTRQQRQQVAARDQARQQAELDVAAAGLSPEQQSTQNLAMINRALTGYDEERKAAGLPKATPEEKAEFFNELISKQYGFTQPRPVWKEYQAPDGITKQWLDASRPDTIPSGWTAVAPGAARGGGSDFWKTVTAKYGQNPNPAQIEAERRRWMALGAHGTETVTTVDAAGNSRAIRVPTFGPGQQMPAGLMPPETTAPGGDLATPQDWAANYQTPPDIEAPLAPARPSTAGAPAAGPAAGAGSAAAAPLRTPMTVTPVTPAAATRLQSVGLTPPSDPVMVAPDNPADAQAALAEADRLGIGRDVRAVAEYRMNPAQVTAARGGQKTKFFELVARVNPAYDMTKWNAVEQARKSFTAGGLDAKNMQSLSLATNHLDKLVNAYSALDNTEFPDANRLRNAARVRTGYGGVAAVDSAANAVSGEMSQVFKNSGATDQEIQSWREQFDHNMAPDAFGESVGTMTDLMAGRMVGEAQNYVNTFGSLKGFPLLAPKTVEILSGIDTDGARLMLEVNHQAMVASGIKAPAPGQPTTAPSPASAAQPQGAGAQGAGAATITLSHAMEIYKQQHPGAKNVSKQTVVNDLKKYGQSYVDDLP